MSSISLEEQIAVALAYGNTEMMAAMGAAQSVNIQKQNTGNTVSAMWASYLTSLGRRLIAYKSAELIVERLEDTPVTDEFEIAKVAMNRELRASTEELATQIKHVQKRRALRGKKGRRFNQHERSLIALVAIQEFTRDYCRSCQGAGEIPTSEEAIEGKQPTQECPVCRGNLRHIFTDREREDMFIDYALKLDYDFDNTKDLIKQVGTTRAIIRLAIRTAVVEYSRILR